MYLRDRIFVYTFNFKVYFIVVLLTVALYSERASETMIGNTFNDSWDPRAEWCWCQTLCNISNNCRRHG